MRHVWLVVLLVGLGCGKKSVADRPVEVDTDPVVPAARIISRYNADPFGAGSTYADRELRVSVRADRVGKLGDQLTVVQREGDSEASFLLPLQESGRVKSGATVTVRGRIALGTQNRVAFGQCQLEP
jgi:hypothetical protein